jgi:hypothetical protein
LVLSNRYSAAKVWAQIAPYATCGRSFIVSPVLMRGLRRAVSWKGNPINPVSRPIGGESQRRETGGKRPAPESSVTVFCGCPVHPTELDDVLRCSAAEHRCADVYCGPANLGQSDFAAGITENLATALSRRIEPQANYLQSNVKKLTFSYASQS